MAESLNVKILPKFTANYVVVRGLPALRSRKNNLRTMIFDYSVNQAVFSGFLSGHEIVAIHVLLDFLDRLASILSIDIIEFVAQPQNLFRLNLNIRCLSPRAPRRLVNHNSRVRQS